MVIMNREYIDPYNSFIAEGTLLEDPKKSGLLDLQNFDCQYQKIQTTFNNHTFISELCESFYEQFVAKLDTLNDYLVDIQNISSIAQSPLSDEVLDYLRRFNEFWSYLSKVFEADA